LAPTDLSAVVRDVVNNTREQAEAAGHALRLTLPDEAIVLQADRDRLMQVFTNLISNAIRYTSAGGRIEIVVERQEDTAVVAVRDNGVGITSERLDDIFDMFTQIKHPDGRAKEGLGIGLTLVRQMVGLHGGT